MLAEMTRAQSTPTPLAPLPVAELRGVVHRYRDVVALDGFDLALRAGEVTALLGTNGAGKTTAIKLMLGLLQPTEGVARLFGNDPVAPESRICVGAMMQISGVPETLKVCEHLELFRSYYPSPLDSDEVIRRAGLDGLEDRLYAKLSGGQKQRLLFALALCGDPDLFFLDEPTVGLDVEARRRLWDSIRGLAANGRTVLLTTHYLEEADNLADRIVVIDGGRIVADGTPAEIKTRAAARRIRCRTTVAVREIEILDGVRSVVGEQGVLEIFTSDPDRVLRDLLARDPSLTDLEITGAGLEDAFLHLTSTHPATGRQEVDS